MTTNGVTGRRPGCETLIVHTWMALDGVARAPGAPEGDTSGAARPQGEQAIAEPLNTRPKYAVSATLTEPLEWHNSVVLRGDVAAAVAVLKRQDGGDLLVLGSTQLAPTLVGHDLVEELQLMIDPVVVRAGKGIFLADGALRPLRLGDSRAITTGAILATYARETA